MKLNTIRILALLAALLLAACASDDDNNNDNNDNTVTVDQFEEARLGLVAYVEGKDAPVIKPQALYDNLNDGDTSNDPFILSVRSAEDYAKGHIKGAKNIPWKMLGDAEKLKILPKDKDIVVYCYTGHTGGVATTVLRAMGYKATNMKWGMVGWTKDAAVRVAKPYTVGTDDNDFPTETTANTAQATNTLPKLDVTTSKEPADIVLAAVKKYLERKEPGPVIKPKALYDNLNDGDTGNDPFILSVRSAEDYAKGHIKGAINIPWKTIAKLDNLKKLPTDKTIVVYCYTGHTGGVATTVLNVLGYKAQNMKFGMVSWTKNPDVRVAKPYTVGTDDKDFPFEK